MAVAFASRQLPDGDVEFELLGPWSQSAHEAFLEAGAQRLVLNYARGFQGHDLEFICDLPLTRLEVLARTIVDLSPVEALSSELAELSLVTSHRSRLDLSLFAHLTALACAWSQVADSISDCHSVEDLYLGEYDPEDLTPLAHLSNLRSLRMKERPRVRHLGGIETMNWIANLEIYDAPLDDISALGQRHPMLRSVAFGGCTRLTSLEQLERFSELEALDVSEAGSIESLHPIAGLVDLRRLHLYGSTQILDGDLSPLLAMTSMSDLRLMNRRHYAPSVSSVKEALGIE